MRVKLLQNVIENGGVKISRRKRGDVVYAKDAVVEMSDASAKKYIERGLAEQLTEEEGK